MGSIANVRLGQCDITYNSVVIGHTKGGVEITIKNEVTEVTVDKYGSTPAKAYHKGTRVEVKTTLSEYDFTQMQEVINAATKSGAAATGTITYGSPSNGDTITVDGHTFTKAASGSGSNFSAIAELTTLINALANVNATDNGTTITVTASETGVHGNSIAMSKTGSALVLSGALLTGGTGQLAIGKVAGDELTGAELVLHPSNVDSNDDTQDVTVWKAVIIGDSTIPFKVDGETVFEVTWLAVVSPDDADGDGKGFLIKLGTESDS